MNIIDYLLAIGFKPVKQRDHISWFIDRDYLIYQGLYAELHDDGKFFLWYDIFNPILETEITPENWLDVRLQVTETLLRYDIKFKV